MRASAARIQEVVRLLPVVQKLVPWRFRCLSKHPYARALPQGVDEPWTKLFRGDCIGLHRAFH